MFIKKARKILISTFIVLLSFSWIFLQNVNASDVTPPNFPSCINSTGTVIADFSSGTHGVPGVVTSFQGADKVYAVSDGVVVQCLCPENGAGKQTNWWKIPNLTNDQIESFKTQGWIFIPDGSLWGLESAPYLAMNADFSCTVGNGGGSSGGGGGSSSGGGGSSSSSGVGGGEILGLAATGNIMTIYTLLLLGLFSVAFGYLLKKRS